jgi:murein DD-endopeptidase MepM/ murein hydrolase activator NlpD
MSTPSPSLPRELPSHWLWPVPPWRDYQPEISSPWGTPRRRLDGTRRTHLGVDIMYRRQSDADQRVTFPPHSESGSSDYFMPPDVSALAVDVGKVIKSEFGPRGHSVILHHANGWRTFYQHLVAPRVKLGDVVLPGQVLGTIGGDPTQTPPLRHLHFEVWSGPTQDYAVNPGPSMERRWRIAAAAPALPSRSPTIPGDLVAMTYYQDDTDSLSNARIASTKPGTTGNKPGAPSSRPPPQRHHPGSSQSPRRRAENHVVWVPGTDGAKGHWERRPGPATEQYPTPPPLRPPAESAPPQYPPPQYPAPYPPPQYPPPYPPPQYPPSQYGYGDPYGAAAGVSYVDPYGNPVDAYGNPLPGVASGVSYVDPHGNPVDAYGNPLPGFDPTGFGWQG